MRQLTPREIQRDYERNTGRVIVETLAKRDPLACPAVLVASHGPFAWGRSPAEAVHHAVVLEYVAGLALDTVKILPAVKPMQQALLGEHFFRKHGPGASYGQHGRHRA
jgi:L-ribulose-5-phosphate 4-epimerase